MSNRYIDPVERMRPQSLHRPTWGCTPAKKTAVTQSKKRDEKKGGAGCPGPPKPGSEKVDYLASPSRAGFSDLSTGLSPSQMRRMAL
jgi:hypothetical protein